MSILCPPLSPSGPVVPSLAAYVECKAQALGGAGFGGVVGLSGADAVLVACLTIFVALIGLRLLAGETLSLHDATRAALRIGLVIVFSTNWGAFETVFYKVVMDAPFALANQVLAPLGLSAPPVADAASGIQDVYDAVNRVAASATAASATPSAPSLSATPVAPSGAPQAAAAAPTISRGLSPTGPAGLLLVSSLGGLLAMRLATGLLLSVGPLVIAFALFDGMLGVFEGWISALLGAALAVLSAWVVVTLELDFLNAVIVPRVTSLASPFTDPGLLVTSAIFTMLMLGGFAGAFALARGFRLRLRLRRVETQTVVSLTRAISSRRTGVEATPFDQPARTRAIVDAIRRYGGGADGTAPVLARGAPEVFVDRRPAAPAREQSWVASHGIGAAPRRGARAARTASATRRDSRR